ncbi:MAG: hypothetical protein K6T85_09060 [Gorillibacterium sp.]|nr:hypothetical protein [Gorillibacterium sp.]
MKIRSLLECTVDTANPVSELTAVISAVLATDKGNESAILRELDEAVGNALATLEGGVEHY